MAKRYNAFISYKHGSILPFAQMLARSLRTYATALFALPRNIFRDEDHLVPSASLPQVIHSALERSEYLVLLASPEAASSPWVERELTIWCDELGRTDRIIIVLVEGSLQVDASGTAIVWQETTALPTILRRYLTDVPLFVDLRGLRSASELDEQNPAFRDAVTKIVARLQGVDPQELIGYEIVQHRRRIRIRNGAIGLLTMLTVTSVLGGVYANIQRMEQQRAAHGAIANSLAAQVRLDATRSQDERNALLARQAYLFAERSGKPLSDSVNRALQTAVRPDYFTTSLSAEAGFVSHVAGSPNGRVIAAAGDSNRVRVWDSRLPGGWRTLTLEAGVQVSALALDPQGQWLAIGVREDASVRLWDLSRLDSNGPTLLKGHSAAVKDLAFNAAGTRLASASVDGTVRIWNVEDSKTQPQVLGHRREVITARFVGEGLFTGMVNGEIRAWSTDEDGVVKFRALGESGNVGVLKISDSGRWLARGEFGRDELRLYDLRNPSAEARLLKSTSGNVTAAAFSASEEHLAVGTSEGDILIWAVGIDGKEIRIPSGHGTGVTSVAFFDGSGIVSSGQQDGYIRIRYLKSAVTVSTALSGTVRARFGRDDDHILGLDRENKRPTASILSSASPLANILDIPAQAAGAEWYPTNHGFMSLNFGDKSGAVWPAESATTPTRSFRFAEYTGDKPASVTISNDGQLLAWVDRYDSSVWLVDLTVTDASALRLRDGPIRHTLESPIAADGTPTNVFSSGVRDWSAPLTISSNNARVAVGAGDGTVRVWTVSDPKALPLVLRGLGGWPLSLAFSSDGTKIAVGSTQRTVVVWGLNNQRFVTLRGHEGRVDAVAFAPNRQLLASGGPDGAVRLWDLNVADPQPLVLDESTAVKSLEFSPSGQRLLVSSETSTRVWTASPVTLAERICALVSRNLSFDEWRGFVGAYFSYERTCTSLPLHPSLLEMARTLARTGAPDQAKSLVAQAIALDPEQTSGWSAEVDRAVADGRLAEAEELAKTGDAEGAALLIKKAVSGGATLASPPEDHARQLAAKGLLAQAKRLTQAKDFADAVALLERSIQLAPTAEAYSARGLRLATHGETDKAVADFDRALSLEPSRWDTHARRAEVLRSLQMWSAAMEGYGRALELLREARARLGSIPTNKSGVVDRGTWMALEIVSAERDILLARAVVSSELGDFAGAIADYSSILSATANDSEALYGRGLAFSENGRCDRAIPDLTAVLDHDKKNWQAFVVRGFCHRDLGSYEKGLRDLEAAAALNPQSSDIRDWLSSYRAGARH